MTQSLKDGAMFQPATPPAHYNAITQDYDLRIERLQSRRHSLWRLIRANIWDFFLLVREAWVSLVGFALVTGVSTLYLLYGYRGQDPAHAPPFSVDTALHESIRLMALESDLPLPHMISLARSCFSLCRCWGWRWSFRACSTLAGCCSTRAAELKPGRFRLRAHAATISF